jgi:hypothetical protein
MTLSELVTILKTTGYPVVYSHFNVSENNPMPEPPYITYIFIYSSNMYADNKVYKKINNILIELYTNKKDLQAEAKLEDILDSNEITYQTSEIFIESEKIFQKIYEMRVI